MDRFTKYYWWQLWIWISSEFSEGWCGATSFTESIRDVYTSVWRILCVCRGSLSNSLWHGEVASDILMLVWWTLKQWGNAQKQQVNRNLQQNKAVCVVKSSTVSLGHCLKFLLLGLCLHCCHPDAVMGLCFYRCSCQLCRCCNGASPEYLQKKQLFDIKSAQTNLLNTN